MGDKSCGPLVLGVELLVWWDVVFHRAFREVLLSSMYTWSDTWSVILVVALVVGRRSIIIGLWASWWDRRLIGVLLERLVVILVRHAETVKFKIERMGLRGMFN